MKTYIIIIIMTELNLDDINNYIENYCDYEFLKKIEDSYLLEEYKKQKSVKQQIKLLKTTLSKHIMDENTINNIINDYIPNLIPPGTKGNLRGKKFNLYIEKKLKEKYENDINFELVFEKDCPWCKTGEIPDWYLKNKLNNKTIIGLNQLSLWGGGQQINRGNKYMNLQNIDNIKYLSVVGYNIKFKTYKNKGVKIFQKGLKENKICFPTDLLSKIEKLIT